MKRTASHLLLFCTGLWLLFTLAWTVSTYQQVSAQQTSLDRKQRDIESLTQLRAQHAHAYTAVKQLDAEANERLMELPVLLRQLAPNQRADARRREILALLNGWQAQRWEIHVESMPLDIFGRLLTVLESQRPPWRVMECTLVAAEQRPGEARVTLIVEGIEKR